MKKGIIFSLLAVLIIAFLACDKPTDSEDDKNGDEEKGGIKVQMKVQPGRNTIQGKKYAVYIDTDEDPANGAEAKLEGTWEGGWEITKEELGIKSGTYKIYAIVDIDNSGATRTLGDFFSEKKDIEIKTDGTAEHTMDMIQGKGGISGTITAGSNVTAGNNYYMQIEDVGGNTEYSMLKTPWDTTGTTQAFTFDKLPAGVYKFNVYIDLSGDGTLGSGVDLLGFNNPVTISEGAVTTSDITVNTSF